MSYTKNIAMFLTLAALGVGAAQAGVYDPKNPASMLVRDGKPQALPFELFRDQLDQVMAIGNPQRETPPRTAFLKRRDELIAKGIDSLDGNEMVELAFVQLRLREFDAALELLKRAELRDSRNFWIQIHLAAAYQMTGQIGEAARYLEAALDFFPATWPGGEAQKSWYRQVEKSLLRLLRLRMQEQRGQPPGRLRPPENVDRLFGDVRWIGPSGEYEAGALADAEKPKLPPDAIAVVQQLLLWFPDDVRLYWLLGELYNAAGDIDTADKIFDGCVDARRFDAALLKEHRKKIKEAIAARPAPMANDAADNWLPSITTLWIVGGIVGVLAAGLLYLQGRELMRRLRKSSVAD